MILPWLLLVQEWEVGDAKSGMAYEPWSRHLDIEMGDMWSLAVASTMPVQEDLMI